MCGEGGLTRCTHQESLCPLFQCESLFFFPPAEHRPSDQQFSLSQISSDLYHSITYQIFKTTVVFLSCCSFHFMGYLDCPVSSSFLYFCLEDETKRKMGGHFTLGDTENCHHLIVAGLGAAGTFAMVQQWLC